MRKRAFAKLFAAILFLAVAGCATIRTAEHSYVMKGQILELNNNVAYLCIGTAEGAKPGQEFPVYRYERIPYAGEKGGNMKFKRELVGAVKITQVVHEHYAEADVVRGDVRVHDVAEL
ncbi:MAG TPA: hypothetical protein VF799_10160 [Geobacteraceae bacterium]